MNFLGNGRERDRALVNLAYVGLFAPQVLVRAFPLLFQEGWVGAWAELEAHVVTSAAMSFIVAETGGYLMVLTQHLRDARRERLERIRREGLEEGLEAGLEAGREEGREIILRVIRENPGRAWTPEELTDELEKRGN